MTDTPTPDDLGDRLRQQAKISTRLGQHDDLYELAEEADHLTAENEKLQAIVDEWRAFRAALDDNGTDQPTPDIGHQPVALRCGWCGHWEKGERTKDQIAAWLDTHRNATLGVYDGEQELASTCPHPCGGDQPQPISPAGDRVIELMASLDESVRKAKAARDAVVLARGDQPAGRRPAMRAILAAYAVRDAGPGDTASYGPDVAYISDELVPPDPHATLHFAQWQDLDTPAAARVEVTWLIRGHDRPEAG